MKYFTAYRGKGIILEYLPFLYVFRVQFEMSFCDTQHEEGTLMSDEDIVMEVAKYSTQVVILTGGEPGLWIDEKLVDALHHEGKYVCIETNGTCLLPENIDWVTCSPKEGAKINLDRIDEVKVVYVGQDVSAYLDLSASHYFCSLVLVLIQKK